MNRYHPSAGSAVGRAVTAALGGYLLALTFCAGFAAVLCRLAGLARADAFIGAAMLAFLVWPSAAIFSYATVSARRAAAGVFGAALLFGGLAWALGPLPTPR
jgi:hypothetical protein